MSAAPAPLRDALATRVADILRREILAGSYELGQRLIEAEFAKRFNVSHGVVREAFQILQGDCLVVADPYRGRSVFRMESHEIPDLFIARAFEESWAATLAVERLTKESADRIAEQARRLREEKPPTLVEWFEIDYDFHRALWAAADNPWLETRLIRLVVPLRALPLAKISQPQFDPNSPPSRYQEWERSGHPHGHQRIAAAVLRRNAEAARRAVILHILKDPRFRQRRKELFAL
ncbi:MAG: GntR family transcriptional regulator [Bryobacteraceae bacterium]